MSAHQGWVGATESVLYVAVLAGWLAWQKHRRGLHIGDVFPQRPVRGLGVGAGVVLAGCIFFAASVALLFYAVGHVAHGDGPGEVRSIFGSEVEWTWSNEVLRETVGEGTLSWSIKVLIFAPIVEELVFRGILLRRWSARWGVVPGVGLSSLLFASFHPPWMVSLVVFPAGVFLGLLYVATGRLWAPMAAHAMINGIVLLLHGTGWAPFQWFVVQTGGSSGVLLLFLWMLAGASLTWCLVWIWRGVRDARRGRAVGAPRSGDPDRSLTARYP